MPTGAAIDWTQLAIDTADARLPSGQRWDVIADQRGPAPGLCVCFCSAGAAHAALTATGFTPTRLAIDVPELQPWHDRTTVMKFGRPDGALVVVARRAAPTV